MAETNSLYLKDFSGGITDDGVDCAVNQYLKADNLLIDDDKKLFSRPGSRFLSSDYPQLPTGNQRVGAFHVAGDDLFAVSGQKLYRFVTGTGWSELTGPSGNSAFPAASASTRYNFSTWKAHIFATDNAGSSAIKIYKDGSGVYRLRQAGLPRMAEPINYSELAKTTDAITLANAIRTAMLGHFASTASHVVADTVSAALIGSAATDLDSLITLTTSLIAGYVSHFNDYRVSSLYHNKEKDNSALLVPEANAGAQTLSNTNAPEDLAEVVERLADLREKYNVHEGNDDIHQNSVGLNVVTAPFVEGVTSGPVAAQNIQTVYDLANLIKRQFNAHLANSGAFGAHPTAPDVTNVISAPDATTPDTLQALILQLRQRYDHHDDDAELGAAWQYHIAQEASDHSLSLVYGVEDYVAPPYPDFFAGLRSGNVTGMVSALNELKTQINAHIYDQSAHYSVTPLYDTNVIPGVDLDLANYLYAFVYFYEYAVGDQTFQDFGPVLEKSATDVISIELEGLTISNIPVLTNSLSTHYDTANIKIKIYRTVDNGTAFFEVGEIDNGTTTFTDTVKDADLVDLEPIYTTGGVEENLPPPQAKYLHIVNNRAYWGNFTDEGEAAPQRIRQAITDDPDSVPSFDVDLSGENMGISSAKNIPIAFSSTGVFRLEGSFDEQGRGQIEPVALTTTLGCIAPHSLVQTDGAVFFAGQDGFYFTDGYQVMKVSNEWNRTYQRLVSTEEKRNNLSGVFDRIGRRIYWTCARNGTENDSVFVLDMDFGVGQDRAFTTWSNSTSFAPTALALYQGKLLRGDQRGFIFLHEDDLLADPRVDLTASTSVWEDQAIRYDYLSPHLDFQVNDIRKYGVKVAVNCKNVGDLSLQLTSINDAGESFRDFTPIRYRENMLWGDPDIVWGTYDVVGTRTLGSKVITGIASTTLLTVGMYLVEGGGFPVNTRIEAKTATTVTLGHAAQSTGAGRTYSFYPTQDLPWNPQGLIEEQRFFPPQSLRFSYKQIQLTNAYVVIENSDSLGLVTVDDAAKTATLVDAATEDFQTDLVDHYIAFESDDYTQQYLITARAANVVTFADSEDLCPLGDYQFEIRGYPKNDKLYLWGYSLQAGAVSKSLDDAGAGESGENA